MLRLQDHALGGRMGWKKGFIEFKEDPARGLTFLFLANVAATEIEMAKTGRFKLASGLTHNDHIDCTVPGQALVYVDETGEKGISAVELKERAAKNRESLVEHGLYGCRVYHDTQTVINNPEMVLVSVLRRGLVVPVVPVVPVTAEEDIAGKLEKLSVADTAMD
jgi:hypothetical protein